MWVSFRPFPAKMECYNHRVIVEGFDSDFGHDVSLKGKLDKFIYLSVPQVPGSPIDWYSPLKG